MLFYKLANEYKLKKHRVLLCSPCIHHAYRHACQFNLSTNGHADAYKTSEVVAVDWHPPHWVFSYYGKN